MLQRLNLQDKQSNTLKGQHIILMDGEKLAYNMIEHEFGVSTKKIFSIKALDMDLFEEYQEE